MAYDELPLHASHFYSPLLIEPPCWAAPEREVTPGDVVQRYFLLEGCKPKAQPATERWRTVGRGIKVEVIR